MLMAFIDWRTKVAATTVTVKQHPDLERMNTARKARQGGGGGGSFGGPGGGSARRHALASGRTSRIGAEPNLEKERERDDAEGPPGTAGSMASAKSGATVALGRKEGGGPQSRHKLLVRWGCGFWHAWGTAAAPCC